jgi:hypothetical protein
MLRGSELTVEIRESVELNHSGRFTDKNSIKQKKGEILQIDYIAILHFIYFSEGRGWGGG